MSCAEKWWLDTQSLMSQLERQAANIKIAEDLEQNNKSAMAKAVKTYPLFVNYLFMKRADCFVKTVPKKAMGVEP